MINTLGQWVPDFPGQQAWTDPAYMRYYNHAGSVQHQQPQQVQQPAASPVLHADIIPVDDEQVVNSYFVQPGNSQMFMKKDNSAFYVKTAYSDGREPVVDVFDKRPPAPPAPKLDPADVVKKEYLEQRLASLLHPAQAEKEAVA